MKKFITKLLSIILIIFGFYHIVISIFSIFYLYPRVLNSTESITWRLQESLVEKAFILYLSTIINGLYGLTLLLRPPEKVKTVHLLAGMVLVIFSFFFVTRTELTTDPVAIIFFNLLMGKN